ncbi:response regulator [Paenibacillus sp. J5C_2022]|uniref:response regulator transcription factor n=1 Tax=Paenibacillus sp. J5C2022 TaxID=2977129 RepID=UPI0021CF9E65|nr:response regulator [Paenibacillus sp. J5C2022]MCU6709039.1 response regulator [Paenibacillus sp. J5C2022]
MYSVLIVDDEPLICEGIRSKLLRMNRVDISSIRIAYNGVHAQEQMASKVPDLILCDIKMPDMDGISLMKATSAKYRGATFIFLSGFGDYNYVREAFKYGAADYLLKPVSFTDLQKQLLAAIKLVDSRRSEASEADDDTADRGSIIDLSKTYIQQNFQRPLTLSNVANEFSMNYSYFSTLFKKETGMTFTSYLTKIRMKEAKKLLGDPTIRIHEIAGMVGYDSAYNFSRAFKSHFLLSPNRYRSESLHSRKH